jgi:hypothetical protein
LPLDVWRSEHSLERQPALLHDQPGVQGLREELQLLVEPINLGPGTRQQ